MAAKDQVSRNAGAQLSNTFYVNGIATDADGDVTLVVTNPTGTEIFNDLADDLVSSDGKYEWTMPPQANLTELTLNWTADFNGVSMTATTKVEIVGAFLFTLSEARSYRGGKMADTDKYPNLLLVDVREEISQLFEEYCKVSFTPRYKREVLDGEGRPVMYLARREVQSVQSVVEDGITLTEDVDFYSYSSGRLLRNDSAWSTLTPKNVIVDYEHGYESVPGPMSRAALALLDSLVVGSDLMDRKVSQTDESGTFRLSYPDMSRDRPTGIPYVDARLNEYLELWGVV